MPSSASSENLNLRLNTLSDSIKQTQSQIQRLYTSKAAGLSQPASPATSTENLENTTSDSSTSRTDLSAEIHEALKKEEEGFELIRQEVLDFVGSGGSSSSFGGFVSERDREKSRLSIQIVRLGEDLKHARSFFRKAQLRAKQTCDIARQAERNQYLQNLRDSALIQAEPLNDSLNERYQPGASRPTSPNLNGNGLLQQQIKRRGGGPSLKRRTSDEILLDASNDVTLALRRTHALIQSELSRSQYAQETLERSTAQLSNLGETYTSIDDLLSRSKSLLSTLVSSQKSDTWYLETAFWILVATVGWLIFRRWLYGPIWLLILLPLKIVYRTSLGFLAAFGITANSAQKIAIASSSGVRAQASYLAGDNPIVIVEVSKASAIQTGREEGVKEAASLSDEIAQMAEQSRQGDQVEKNEPVVRGDGTVLQESDKPRNPKKKMFEAVVDEPQGQQEGQGKQSQAQEEQQQRDEL